jgi:perosamine synthetase
MSQIPYGKHLIDEADIAAVVEVLRSNWLTTGPKVAELETALGNFLGIEQVVAVNSGTAALHCAMHAIGIGPGDEVIVPAMTFAASANAVLYVGGTPVFADVTPDTLLIDPTDVERKISPRTRAIIAVDYAGAACDYDALRALSARYRLSLVSDACHSLGGRYRGAKVGTLADVTCFSMHPVKPITSGEGGFCATANPWFAERMRAFRNHGIDLDFRQRQSAGRWKYAMTELGFNYRLCDIQCALALSQLSKLDRWTERRQQLARRYDDQLDGWSFVRPLGRRNTSEHAFHLYVVRWDGAAIGMDRDAALTRLRERGIGVNVHYLPVYLHPFYQRRLKYSTGLCPVAEEAYGQILSLPIFPEMSEAMVDAVVAQLDQCQRRANVA